MNKELIDALAVLEKEKDISREVIMEAIENSLLTACKNHFGKADNIHVHMDRETGDYEMYAEKTVVEEVSDPALEISLEDARKKSSMYQLGDTIREDIRSASFGRIATQNAKNVILQKLREEERKSVYDRYNSREHEVITGVVQRHIGKNININLGKADAIMPENEQVKSESYRPTERIKVLILEVKDTPRGPHILVSRTHPDLVKRLFEAEVAEIQHGHDDKCDQNAGKRAYRIDHAHDDLVDDAAGVAAEQSQDAADQRAREHGQDRDEKREAASRHRAAEDVPTHVVGAEQVMRGRRRHPRRDVHEVDVVRRVKDAAERQQKDRCDEDAADEQFQPAAADELAEILRGLLLRLLLRGDRAHLALHALGDEVRLLRRRVQAGLGGFAFI